MNSARDTLQVALGGWVAPFGDPGINDRSPLTRAFRSGPRPSSPRSAKASAGCPSHASRATPNGKHHRPNARRLVEATGETLKVSPIAPAPACPGNSLAHGWPNDAPGLTRGPSGQHSSPFRRHFVTEPADQGRPRPPLPSRSQLASSQLSISNTPPGPPVGG